MKHCNKTHAISVWTIVIGFILLTLYFSLVPLVTVAAHPSHPQISILDDYWDFGEMYEGDIVTKSFAVKNTGGDVLEILGVNAGCRCSDLLVERVKISPGKKRKITLRFNSAGKSDHFYESIWVESNDPVIPSKTVRITGYIKPMPVNKANRNNKKGRPALGEFGGGRLQVIYFYTNHCDHCARVRDNVMDNLVAKYGQEVVFRYLDVSNMNNYKTLLSLEEKAGKKVNKTPPLVVVGEEFFVGEENIAQNLEKWILKNLKTDWKQYRRATKLGDNKGEDLLKKSFDSLSILTVAGGGLLDGINPCAFATLIFFLSYLAYVGKKGKDLLKIGMAFVIAVFLTYLVIGLGLTVLSGFMISPLISRIFNLIMAGLLFVFGLLSFLDYLRVKKGQNEQLTLQLSRNMKRRIHAVIRKRAASNSYLLAGLGIGVLVALFEFPCTGQIYFPIVFTLRQMGSFQTWLLAFGYLLIYNLLFILPLIIVLYLAYRGTTSQRLAEYMKKNLGRVKLATAGLFMGLAVLLIWM
jgi:cytochrome c biogenesis protein CcdA